MFNDLNNVSEFVSMNVSVLKITDEINLIKSRINFLCSDSGLCEDQISSEIDSLELRLFELEKFRNSSITEMNKIIREGNPGIVC